jgi:hypothetical protein
VVAVFAIHAQAAFASLLEPSYSADNSTLFWGVIFAAVVVSLLHFVHTLNKVFLFFGAAVFWGAIALAGNDLNLAALFTDAGGVRPAEDCRCWLAAAIWPVGATTWAPTCATKRATTGGAGSRPIKLVSQRRQASATVR